MSPTDKSVTGTKGKRVPGRPGRFDPSMPLHMTTRRAAKHPTANGSSSTNGSVEDDESRRGSFDDLRPITSHSNGSQVSVKSRRLSEASIPIITPDAVMDATQLPEEIQGFSSISKPLSPMQPTPSPSRKRKRSSSTTAPAQQIEPSDRLNDVPDTSFEMDNSVTEYGYEPDTVESIRVEDLSDRDASPNSSPSEDLAPVDKSFTAQSVDATPAASGPVSPATSESERGSQEDLPLAKPLDARLEEVAQAAEEDAADAAEDVDDEGAEDVDDIDEQVRSDDEGRPRRRFGGRRRAAHPIPRVEAAMRRQAELKSAYRAITRALKPVLAETAQRTVDDLEANPEAHVQAMEYNAINKGLDGALEERQDHLQAQHELNTKQLKQTLEAEQDALKARWKQQLDDMKDTQLYRLEHEILKVARNAQVDGVDAEYETEDEDDPIPYPKHMGYKWKRGDALDVGYHSRSRLPMETVHATAERELRFEMQKLLNDVDEDDKPEELRGFTIMDSTPRKAAIARREGVKNTNILAEAGKEFERRSKIPTIDNKDCIGLQMLGDLATRPSIGAPLGTQIRDPFMSPRRQRPIPPHLQLQTNYPDNSIPVEMSPRTTQALGDRFNSTMPPPMTPRQPATPSLRSPEAMRIDQPVPSPTTNINRFGGLQQSPTHLHDSRPESWNGPSSEQHSQSQPRSEHRPEGHFLTPQLNHRRIDPPLWREYSREQSATLYRRNSSQSDRPQSLFLGMREENQRNNNAPPQDQRTFSDRIKNESSPQHRPPLVWPEPLSSAGASDNRLDEKKSPIESSKVTDPPRSPHSRRSSTTFSVNEYRPGNSQSGDGRLKHRGSKILFPHKTNKEQRSGMSRRHWSKDYRRGSKSFGHSGSAGSPTPAAPSFAGSPTERAPPPASWQGPPPPQHSPFGPPPPPPAGPYPQQSPYGRPPAPNYASSQQSQDFYQHRNSFPPPPSANWNQLPPTPLYAVPQPQPQQQHPPPPGVPADQYHRPYAPPPPPGYHPPVQPPTPQSAPGTYGHQFGGQRIAPAQPSYVPGFRPAPSLPAFAQQAQQQQQNSSNHSRRRTQSDAPQFSKFHSWNPPNGRR